MIPILQELAQPKIRMMKKKEDDLLENFYEKINFLLIRKNYPEIEDCELNNSTI